MSNLGDMSIRPTPPAELPSISRVADRDERGKQGARRREERRKQPQQQTQDEPGDESPPQAEDDAGGTIDLMA